jgi:hypothetical protein
MADTWYCGRSSKKFGPFTSAQLKKLADTGKLQPTDTIWKEGIEQGVPATKVKGLFSPAPAPPPPASGPAEAPAASGEETPEESPSPGSSEQVETDEYTPQDPAATRESGSEATDSEPEQKTTPPAAPPQEGKKGRILSIKGGILSSQDGIIFRFRKKCEQCGYGDTAMTTMRIRSGIIRADFFCRKCRKSRPVEIHGVM